MVERDTTVEASFPRLVGAGRLVAAIVIGGILAALAWMFALQEGHTGRIFGVTWTEHDFPDGLGNALGATDTARVGFSLTLGLGVIVAALYAAVERWLPGRWIVKGLWFAPILFLAWGLLFTPLVNSRQVLLGSDFVFLPTGAFGVDAGAKTIISGVAASLIASLILARVDWLARDASWWQEHPDVGHGMNDDRATALLELPEERPEQGVKGAP